MCPRRPAARSAARELRDRGAEADRSPPRRRRAFGPRRAVADRVGGRRPVARPACGRDRLPSVRARRSPPGSRGRSSSRPPRRTPARSTAATSAVVLAWVCGVGGGGAGREDVGPRGGRCADSRGARRHRRTDRLTGTRAGRGWHGGGTGHSFTAVPATLNGDSSRDAQSRSRPLGGRPRLCPAATTTHGARHRAGRARRLRGPRRDRGGRALASRTPTRSRAPTGAWRRPRW
jgi:hypothetical protein